MFPKTLRLLICFVLLALLLCACQTPEAPNDGDKTADSTGEETTADPTAIFDGVELPAWKSAYVEILRDCREWTTHYALISLDDDAISELYVVGRAASDGSRLYAYKNGAVEELEMNFTYRKAYFERSGKIAYCGGRMGNDYVTVCELTEEGFVAECVKRYGDAVAVGVDIRDGYVAIRGWTESSALRYGIFLGTLAEIGVKTVICTDISRDGAMKGANHGLYRELSEKFDMQIVASGGVSSMEDVKKLTKLDIYGAIIGKAYYTGAIDLCEAIEVSK